MIKTIFGPIEVNDQVPEGTLMLIPPVERVRYIIEATGEVIEYLRWNPKQGAVITNIGGGDE